MSLCLEKEEKERTGKENGSVKIEHRTRTTTTEDKKDKWEDERTNAVLPVWLSWEVLLLLRDMPTMACILAPMLERLFLSSMPTVPTAVSDWLPSVFSRLHMSPLMLVLLVMFMPPVEPICLCFILDAKSLSATTIVRREAGEDREERRGERREGDVEGDTREKELCGKEKNEEKQQKQEKWRWRGEKDRV